MTNNENKIEGLETRMKTFTPNLDGYGMMDKRETEIHLGISLTDKEWDDITSEIQTELEGYMESYCDTWINEILNVIKENIVKTVLVDQE